MNDQQCKEFLSDLNRKKQYEKTKDLIRSGIPVNMEDAILAIHLSEYEKTLKKKNWFTFWRKS